VPAGSGQVQVLTEAQLRALLGNVDPSEIQWVEESNYTRADDEAAFPNVSREAMQRKWRNMSVLREVGLSPLPSLPCIESSEDCGKMRNSQEVLQRLMINIELTGLGNQPNKETYISLRNRLRLRFKRLQWLDSHCSEGERTLLGKKDDDANAENDGNEWSWRCEDIWLLCHTLHLIDLPNPVLPRNMARVVTLPFADAVLSPQILLDNQQQFLAAVIDKLDDERRVVAGQLRSVDELLDLSDLLYRFHWCMRDASIKCIGGRTAHMADLIVARWRTVVDWILFGYEYDRVPLST